jgi:hypothetical protein
MSKKAPKSGIAKEIKLLPDELIPIHNSDKDFHEEWYEGRNPLNLCHPWRGVIVGKPNSGKSTIIKNLLIRADPPFEEVYVIHCDPTHTKEYKDCGENIKMLGSIPSPDQWEGKVKTLVILDDLEFKMMNKDQKRNLDRLYGYVSTHKNISACLCSQDCFNVPPSVRRCANLFIMWKMEDLDSMARMATKTGLKASNLYTIFDTICTKYRDSLWLDGSQNTPYPIRKNGFIPIEKIDGQDSLRKKEKDDNFLIKR